MFDEGFRRVTTEREVAKRDMGPEWGSDTSLVLPARTNGTTSPGRWGASGQVPPEFGKAQGNINTGLSGRGGAW